MTEAAHQMMTTPRTIQPCMSICSPRGLLWLWRWNYAYIEKDNTYMHIMSMPLSENCSLPPHPINILRLDMYIFHKTFVFALYKAASLLWPGSGKPDLKWPVATTTLPFPVTRI